MEDRKVQRAQSSMQCAHRQNLYARRRHCRSRVEYLNKGDYNMKKTKERYANKGRYVPVKKLKHSSEIISNLAQGEYICGGTLEKFYHFEDNCLIVEKPDETSTVEAPRLKLHCIIMGLPLSECAKYIQLMGNHSDLTVIPGCGKKSL